MGKFVNGERLSQGHRVSALSANLDLGFVRQLSRSPTFLRSAIDSPCPIHELRNYVRAYLKLLDCDGHAVCERVVAKPPKRATFRRIKINSERSERSKVLSEDTVATSEHRHRHPLFTLTRSAIRDPVIDYRHAWQRMGIVISNAKSYVKKVKDRAIVLRNIETDEIKVIPYFTRFSDGYYKKAMSKLKSLHGDRGVFLTLTIDPKRFTSLEHAYTNLQRGWNRLLTMLRKRHRHLEFVKIVEFQKSGSPHLHVLFFGIPRLIDANELREFWDKKYGEGTFVNLKPLHNGSNRVISYLVKYMRKYLEIPDVEFHGTDGLTDAPAFQQLALSWALNLRAFSTSRGILDKPLSNSNGFWEFLGVFELSSVWSWDGKHFSEVEADFVALKPP